ncbi:MAG: uncharacterized protein KVP18_002617 [Porospora cf. gigantea A]|uniref:uncharacterized protein n=2 Tax=Porospora cf. gigantea A TaxID=2853593 RepID=UPI00355998A3|nr:MAG: hypothetical protein KVP18_002617 [Porospora cf. gigantea A]
MDLTDMLPDPYKDRVITEVDAPPNKPLAEELLFPRDRTVPPDWPLLRDFLRREGRIAKEHVLYIVSQVTNMLAREPNLLKLKDPITVVGDIHGQYYDFLKLLDVGGKPDSTQYLFLGDYVDRGSFSIPVVLLLFVLKMNFPKSVFMLRGNHECRQMTAFFNFRHECIHKYDMEVYTAFMQAFDNLPLAATINNKFLAVHGGLSPALKAVHNVLGVNRFQEPPRTGLFCDLLWADPVDEDKEEHVLARTKEVYVPNDVRGCSFYFYYNAAVEFLDKNNLLSVIRAHEAQLEGYKMHQTNMKTGFPTVITIFSAPNYCDVYNNKAAVLKFKNNTLNIQQFNFSPHPYHLSCFMDVFAWSIPFVSEKVTELLYGLLDSGADFDDVSDVVLPPEVQDFLSQQPASPIADAPPTEETGLTKERADALRKKVQSVGRLMRVFKTLREQNELVVQLKGVTPGHRIPPGSLLQGEFGLRNELEKFQKAQQVDRVNERRPDM